MSESRVRLIIGVVVIFQVALIANSSSNPCYCY